MKENIKFSPMGQSVPSTVNVQSKKYLCNLHYIKNSDEQVKEKNILNKKASRDG